MRSAAERSETESVEHAVDELRVIAAVAPTEHVQALASSAAGNLAAAAGELGACAASARGCCRSLQPLWRTVRGGVVHAWRSPGRCATPGGARPPGMRLKQRARRSSASALRTGSSWRRGSSPGSRTRPVPNRHRLWASRHASSRSSGCLPQALRTVRSPPDSSSASIRCTGTSPTSTAVSACPRVRGPRPMRTATDLPEPIARTGHRPKMVGPCEAVTASRS